MVFCPNLSDGKLAKFGSFYQKTETRKKRSWAWLIWVMLLAALVYALNTRLGLTPPLGRLLSPFEGAFQICLQQANQPGIISLKGKNGPITIQLDEYLIPHIKAQSEEDLYLAQGYITALHRLWQMDFQNLASAGRLSEVIGEKTIEYDKFQRRFGLKEAARRSGQAMMAEPETRAALLAYTEGVNKAIAEWPERQMPLEFKILDYKPSMWKPEDSGLLLKRMAYTLSGLSDDKDMNQIMEKFGKSVVDQLFPNRLPEEAPIISLGTKWTFKSLPIPKVPLSLGWTDTTDTSIPDNGIPKLEDDNDVGSNNWAINGKKTRNGYPILANDPHLSMKLPSTWYIIEMEAPGYHCMGASLPGAPGIISGFNSSFSWGITNGYPDVTDWYKIFFKDNNRRQYWLDNKWAPSQLVVENIAVRGQKPIKDSIYWTHLGPVVYLKKEKPFYPWVPAGHALRWVAHDSGNELLSFLKLNKAKNIKEGRSAIQTYGSPAQNFVMADAEGNIAMFAQHGKIPLRWKEQGKFLLLGGNLEHHWQGFIPKEQLPQEENPARGYVSSANQIPTDSLYPYYLNWNYYNLERAKRINQVLDSATGVDLAAMARLQADNKNLWAEKTLAKMLQAVSGKEGKAKWAINILRKWNFYNHPAEVGPTLFEAWMKEWMRWTWQDNFGLQLRWPDKHITWQIFLEKDNSDWFDLASTKPIEKGSDLLVLALHSSLDSLAKDVGNYSAQNRKYQWGHYKGTEIGHLGMIAGLGTPPLFIGGGKGIVNATGPVNGPSWKMVVELGPQPQALGIYPGGQSGNPASPFYDNFIETWRNGQHIKLQLRPKP